eukprot:SAG11_NODE_190_length_12980_cov_11.633802_2_plen_106_part_00
MRLETSSFVRSPLQLCFEHAPPPEAPRVSPAVPRIFTGQSRLGDADGPYLVERFTLARFTKEAGVRARARHPAACRTGLAGACLQLSLLDRLRWLSLCRFGVGRE